MSIEQRAGTALRIYRQSFAADPPFDTAVSHALLRAVSEGRAAESLRLYTPADALAFSVLDRTRPGFAAAVAVARERGFTPILRLAGGHAAAFECRALAFAWTVPVRNARVGIKARFEAFSAVLMRALRGLGIDAHVGEVPGEYCPGEFSVNARGRVKLAGIGQRVMRHAAHIGGVLIVENAERVREVLGPVYRALELEMDLSTVGAVADECGPIDANAVAEAFLGEVRRERSARSDVLGAPILEEARALAAAHSAAAATQGLRQAGKIVSES